MGRRKVKSKTVTKEGYGRARKTVSRSRKKPRKTQRKIVSAKVRRGARKAVARKKKTATATATRKKKATTATRKKTVAKKKTVTKNKKKKKKKKTVTKKRRPNASAGKKRNQREAVFHREIVKAFRKAVEIGSIPEYAVMYGRLDGHVRQTTAIMNKHCGYIRGDPDIQILGRSYDGTYMALNGECKNMTGKPRATQLERLKQLLVEAHQFPCLLQCGDDMEKSVRGAIELFVKYFRSPTEELDKYMLTFPPDDAAGEWMQ